MREKQERKGQATERWLYGICLQSLEEQQVCGNLWENQPKTVKPCVLHGKERLASSRHLLDQCLRILPKEPEDNGGKSFE